MGLLLLSVAAASLIVGPCLYFHQEWIMVAACALFFATALWVYLRSLGSIERYALQHREELFTELCKSE